MLSAPIGLSEATFSMLPFQGHTKLITKFQSGFTGSFAMAFACVTFVTIFVPERPNQLASICEKYNSAIACQVW